MSSDMNIFSQFLASSVLAKAKSDLGISDARMRTDGNMSTSIFHFHGGASPPIAWNDVQEASYINTYSGLKKKISVPSYPTEGYNQHHHTSEYDGGVLPGVTGNHTHKDNRNGGFAFAIFAPASGIPMSDWED